MDEEKLEYAVELAILRGERSLKGVSKSRPLIIS
jgi:hypothetical protein